MDGNKIDIEKLIEEVKLRPTLWDMTTDDYSDRAKRKECWDEITDAFADRGTAPEEKQKLGELLHKKWKNIRDRFARELQDAKYEGRNKRAPYLHAHQLHFLKDKLVRKKTSCASEKDEDPSRKRPLPDDAAGRKRAKIDEDDNRHFLLSLLPSMSALPRWLNTNCRIELMQCISKYETYALQQCQPPFSVPQLHLVPPGGQPSSENEGASPAPSLASEMSGYSAEEDSKFGIY
ncbi:hypothetical protein NQ315_002253 [Exocentrus adspersus]|uniref:MADF domain-containing protein n=1 Tax=Exocentrus adspersus TaxID=1586481 RepID=A0AAV8VS84_9CUCU|nr:hypothetical protein NQ315_002253 [Exocentrus adspersus]